MSVERSFEINRILEVQSAWLMCEQNGPSEAVLQYCTDDVLWLVPELGALQGKSAVQKWLSEQGEPEIDEISLTDVQVHVDGVRAIKTANFSTAVRTDGDELAVVRGTHLWAMHKSAPNGHWLVTHVSWVCCPDTIQMPAPGFTSIAVQSAVQISPSMSRPGTAKHEDTCKTPPIG